MKPIKPLLHLCLALSLAACGGGDLSIDVDGETGIRTIEMKFVPGRLAEHPLPFSISGGLPPYESRIEGCPDWVTLFSDQGILAGTAPAGDHGKTFVCTYVVDDASMSFPQSTSFLLRLAVESPAPLVFDSDTDQTFGNLTFGIGVYDSVMLPPAKGGVAPYAYSLTCAGGGLPPGMGFAPATRVLAGTPEADFRDSCTYTVMDSSEPVATASQPINVEVTTRPPGLPEEAWQFRTRSVAQSEHELVRTTGYTKRRFAVLPHAIGGTEGTGRYELLDLQPPLEFSSTTRVLAYTDPGVNPLVGHPTTYRYQVFVDDGDGKVVHDALCIDVGYTTEQDGLELFATVLIRDDAFWNGTEFQCPDAPGSSSLDSRPATSNPVHSALAPIHARRAIDVAHAAVRDRVRGWSPGIASPRSAVATSVDFAALSGLHEGFDYSGSSESLRVGAELGADSWQAGLVASLTRTDLRYDAATGLAGLGYAIGEHDTEIFSVHPFAAWHAPSGGHVWASLGAGIGDLGHRDDLGFPSRSRSDVRIRAYAVEGSIPLADVLSGELGVEAGFESLAFEIEGGHRISTSLPTLRGREYRAGLAWSAPDSVAPSVSLSYERLTGDGPDGARVEAQSTVSVAGVLDPRLTLRGNARASFGLGGYEQDSWHLGGGVRFAPAGVGRGFGVDVDTRLMSRADGRDDGVGVRGEAGYGLWGGPFLGTLRPYVGLIRYPNGDSIRRSVGLNLLDTPTSQVFVEVRDHSRDRVREIELVLRHRL